MESITSDFAGPSRVAVHFTPEAKAVLDEHRRSLPDLPNRASQAHDPVVGLHPNPLGAAGANRLLHRRGGPRCAVW
jgi:hypothetical protein